MQQNGATKELQNGAESETRATVAAVAEAVAVAAADKAARHKACGPVAAWPVWPLPEPAAWRAASGKKQLQGSQSLCVCVCVLALALLLPHFVAPLLPLHVAVFMALPCFTCGVAWKFYFSISLEALIRSSVI